MTNTTYHNSFNKTDHLNSCVTIKENEFCNSETFRKEISKSRWFLWELEQELTPVLHSLFQKILNKGVLANSFCEVSFTLHQNKIQENKITGQYTSLASPV